MDIYHTGTETIHGKITVHQEFAKLSVSEGFFLCPFHKQRLSGCKRLSNREKESMREAKVEYDDIADIHWWMVDHIHYLPAMIYAVLLIDIVSIVVIIKHSKGLEQDEVLERLKIGCSVAVFLLGMLLVYYIAYLFW